MTITEMFGQSGILAVFGMGTVFLFLVILIIFMKLSSSLIRKFAKPEEGGDAPSLTLTGSSATGSADEEIAAASATVHHHSANNS